MFCLNVSPFPRGGDSRDVENNGSPEGHRLCEPYKNFDGGRSMPGINYILLPKIGERLGEWLKPLLMKKGLGLLEDFRALP